MRSRLIVIVVAVCLIAGAAFAWLRTDSRAREVSRIRKRLTAFAAELSFSERDGALRRLVYGKSISEFFADSVDLEVTLGGSPENGSWTRGRLEELATARRASARGLSVQFLDIKVELDDPPETASAYLTAKIYFTGDPDYTVQEFRLKLIKAGGDWQVRRVATLRTMEQ